MAMAASLSLGSGLKVMMPTSCSYPPIVVLVGAQPFFVEMVDPTMPLTSNLLLLLLIPELVLGVLESKPPDKTSPW